MRAGRKAGRHTGDERCHPSRPDRLTEGQLSALTGQAELVGLTGFEPATSSSQTKRATKLRHSPPLSASHQSGRSHKCPISKRRTAGIRLTPRSASHYMAGTVRGRSSMVEPQSSKLTTRVRFSSPAPSKTVPLKRLSTCLYGLEEVEFLLLNPMPGLSMLSGQHPSECPRSP